MRTVKRTSVLIMHLVTFMLETTGVTALMVLVDHSVALEMTVSNRNLQ